MLDLLVEGVTQRFLACVESYFVIRVIDHAIWNR